MKKRTKTCLVGVREAAHTAHDAEHVVVSRIHVHCGAQVGANGVVGHSQEQGGVINAR